MSYYYNLIIIKFIKHVEITEKSLFSVNVHIFLYYMVETTYKALNYH